MSFVTCLHDFLDNLSRDGISIPITMILPRETYANFFQSLHVHDLCARSQLTGDRTDESQLPISAVESYILPAWDTGSENP